MKTWHAELNDFYNSFMKAYPTGNVPDPAKFPWMVYPVSRGDFGDTRTEQLHMHFYTEEEATPNNKADEFLKAITPFKTINCLEGKLILTPGSWQSVPDETDKNHKHRVIDYSITFLLTR